MLKFLASAADQLTGNIRMCLVELEKSPKPGLDDHDPMQIVHQMYPLWKLLELRWFGLIWPSKWLRSKLRSFLSLSENVFVSRLVLFLTTLHLRSLPEKNPQCGIDWCTKCSGALYESWTGSSRMWITLITITQALRGAPKGRRYQQKIRRPLLNSR